MYEYNYSNNIQPILDSIRSITDFKPEIGIVLGSGLGSLASEVEVTARIPYSTLDNFPSSTVEGHAGEYILGTLEGKKVILMNGRVHYYEGYSMDKVVLPVRVMALLGAKTVILTNAAGSLDLSLQPGSLMCITDQIASFIPSPLIGPCDERLGTRFPEMTRIYSKVLIALAHRVADDLGIKLHDGTYLQITGPAFETNAESRLYAMLGGNAVGMSTACEAIALHNLNIDILGISCITDMAIENDRITTHEEVQKKAKEASVEFKKLVRRIVSKL